MSKKSHSNSELNWFVIAILIGLPIFVICGVIAYCVAYTCSWKEMVIGVSTYYLANISVGIGLHRLWSHGSYKTVKPIEFILMLISTGTLQGPVLAWASDHKFHHAYADTEQDPHSPLKYKNKLKGFLWSHIGWMLFGDITAKNIDKGTLATLGKNKMLTWQLQNYGMLATFMNTVPPMIFGWCIFGQITFQSTMAGLFFAGLGRALQQQMTFCVNSVCHIIGSRKYANDSSRDIWWLFFALLGENWHNFHHAFGRDYRNGHKWYHFDVHKWIIALMSKVGLAWDLVVTPKERIEARMIEMRSNMKSHWQERLQNIENLAMNLANSAKQKLVELEKSASQVADNVTTKAKQKYKTVEESARSLASNIKLIIAESEAMSDRIVDKQIKKLKNLQSLAIAAGLT